MDGRQIKTLGQAVRTFFSFRGPRLIAGNAAAAWGTRLLAGRFGLVDAAICAGVAAWWPLQEWLAHKYLLHREPREVDGERDDWEVARIHRAHHREPWRIELTLLPEEVVEAAIPINAAAWFLLIPRRKHALTAIATYSTMALLYEWTHFIAHTAYKPPLAWARKSQRHHRHHHFRDENKWFGFTVPLVDRVLGTAPDPAAVRPSPTAQRLYDLAD